MKTAKQEWAAMWQLPLVAMLGICGSSAFAFSNGVFLVTMTEALGWSRSAFSSAFLAQVIVTLFVGPIIGRMVDRHGPRRIALTGLVPFMVGFALLGATGSEIWHWWVLVIVQGTLATLISPVVWVTAVVGRFHVSRGLAMAIALAGLGVSTAIWPVIAATYVEWFGWRWSFPAIALSWGIVVVPLALRYFHGPQDLASTDTAQPGAAPAPSSQPAATSNPHYRTALTSRTFLLLATAGGLFASLSLGLIIHLVPILTDSGFDLTAAAGFAGLCGLFSITGRVGMGFLLDRFPTRPMALAVFVLPAIASGLLLLGTPSAPLAILVVMIVGIAAGAETDIVSYIAARTFDQRVFASVYAVILSIFAICASLGPLIAGIFYDIHDSYRLYLLTVAPTALLATGVISLLPSVHGAGHSRVTEPALASDSAEP